MFSLHTQLLLLNVALAALVVIVVLKGPAVPAVVGAVAGGVIAYVRHRTGSSR